MPFSPAPLKSAIGTRALTYQRAEGFLVATGDVDGPTFDVRGLTFAIAAQGFSWLNASIYAPSDGVFRFCNAADTSDVRLDFATDSTLKIQTGTGTDAATLNVNGLALTGVGALANGTVAAPSLTFSSATALGLYRASASYLGFTTGGGAGIAVLGGSGLYLATQANIGWSSTADPNAATDLIIARDAANTLAQRNGTSAQTFRVYGNATGSKYLTLTHDGTNGAISTTSGGVNYSNVALMVSATAPTIASGFGGTPSIVASNGTAAFQVNVGTGGAATGGVLTLPAATTGWVASVVNLTAVAANRGDQQTVQTASTTTSITVQNQTISTGAALAWTASDKLWISCMAY